MFLKKHVLKKTSQLAFFPNFIHIICDLNYSQRGGQLFHTEKENFIHS